MFTSLANAQSHYSFATIRIRQYLLPLLIISCLLPLNVNQYFVLSILFLFLLCNLSCLCDTSYLSLKLLITLLFLPGFCLIWLFEPQQVIRFFVILLLCWTFPYERSLLSRPGLISLTCIFCSLWLVATQILISFQNPIVHDLRDRFYPVLVNYWDYGDDIDKILEFRGFRAGGLYYNPNVLASILYLLHLVVHLLHSGRQASSSPALIRSIYYLILPLSCIGLFLTGSRTYIFVFLFTIVSSLLPKSVSLTLSKKTGMNLLVTVIISSLAVSEVFASLLAGFGGTTEASVTIKNNILLNYIDNISFYQLLFGGNPNIHFDAEYGYWIGISGLFGLLAVLIFYCLFFVRNRAFLYIIISFLLIGIGNSMLYGLLTASLAIPSFVALSNVNTRTLS
jgi:hypothetical protein